MTNIIRSSGLALSLAVLAAMPVGAAETWNRMVEPVSTNSILDPYVRNIRVFSNTPVAGQSIGFAATLGAGIQKVTFNGSSVTATPMNSGLPILRVRTVVANGTDSTNLFTALETYGVYKSTDGGATWTVSNGTGGTALGCVNLRNLSMRSPTELWASTSCDDSSGVWMSLDTGVTWSRLGSATIPADATVVSIVFSGTGPTTVAVAATSRYGFFRSADNGATWTQINNGLPAPEGPNNISTFSVTFLANASQMLGYVEGKGVFRTIDGGANWTASDAGLPAGYHSMGSFSLRESATIHYMGLDKGPIYRSADGGVNWAVWGNTASLPDLQYTRSISGDTATLTGRYYVATINGLFVTTNGTNSQYVNLGPSADGYLTGASMAPNGRTVYGILSEVGKIPDIYEPFFAAAGIGAGIPASTLDSGIVVDQNNAATLYVSTRNRRMFKTIDDGANWTPLAVPGSRAGYMIRFALDPSNSQNLFAAPGNPFRTATGGGLQKSTDAGATFTDSSVGLTTPDSRDINSIAIHQNLPAVMYITTDDGVYRSSSSGASWVRVLRVDGATGNPLPMSSVRHHSPDPTIVWATANHVNPDGTVRASSGVYKSTDSGASWTQVLSGKRVAFIRPEASGRVVAGLVRDPSQPAILASTDGGTTWQAFNAGIGVNDLVELTQASPALGSRTVFASSSTGLYVLDKPGVTVGIVGPGTVQLSPVGTTCTTGCTQRFFHGSTVTATATPATGSIFTGWSGSCTGNTCQLSIDGAKSITATFALATTIPRLANISTRGRVQTGNDVMIGGFVIGGSAAKKVLITARGPSLTAFGVTGAMANPTLQLFSGQTVVASNDDWQTNANAADISATGIAPSSSLESALLVTLNPGAYTAIVSGVGGGVGVGIVEVFEQDRPDIPLINISTRGQVQTGDNVMIGGFIIQGDAPKSVLITARGPSLAPFGITNPLANPSLQLFSGQTLVASNDDFGTASNLAAIQATGVAPTNALESAILITLNPGAYTAIVTGVGGGTGVGIVEVFAQ